MSSSCVAIHIKIAEAMSKAILSTVLATQELENASLTCSLKITSYCYHSCQCSQVLSKKSSHWHKMWL